MGLGDLVARMVAFIRAGYPQGVPETDYVPLLALLRRRLSDDEVAAVATQLAARGEMNIDAADIGVAITRITDELPSQADLDRVQRRLETIGWPVDPDRWLPTSSPLGQLAAFIQRRIRRVYDGSGPPRSRAARRSVTTNRSSESMVSMSRMRGE